MDIFNSDFLIVGGGIAGLRAALTASRHGSVILLTKGKTEETATQKAQGGIAVALDKEKDSTSYHLEDTLYAGAGLCETDAVGVLVNDGVERVKELISMGADFDTVAGKFELNIEGAHRRRRILHAGDYTGKEIAQTLAARVIKDNNIQVKNFFFGKDLIMDGGKCSGIVAYDLKGKKEVCFLSKSVILTTGGACQAYLYTTTPEFATGDGIAMAYRAGAVIRDMEFIQFHPTALVMFKGIGEEIAFPQFLISEAVRGEGAILLNKHGTRFMEKYHKQLELAPRDIVSRAIFEEMRKTDSDHVHLNLSGIDPEKVKKRFPTIYKTCKQFGIDITCDDIPVAPAAHYLMGGIKTDLEGRTCVQGLWAAGEVMSSGVHGANRLASNSLLEGIVFGERAALSAIGYVKERTAAPSKGLCGSLPDEAKDKFTSKEYARHKHFIKKLLWEDVGIVRDGKGIESALKKLDLLAEETGTSPSSFEGTELLNLIQIAKMIAVSALKRTESRGAHYRSDFPDRDDNRWKKHIELKTGSGPTLSGDIS